MIADLQTLVEHCAQTHLPSTCPAFTTSAVTVRPGVNPLGYPSEHDPFTGLVVEVGQDFTVVKTRESHFVVVDAAVLRQPLAQGQLVAITPYARKRFDGTRVKDPAYSSETGLAMSKVGSSVSPLPLSEPIRTDMGKHLIDTLQRLRCPDGVRTLSNFLADIGAINFLFIEPDVDGEDYMLLFNCTVSSFNGGVTVGYRQADDTFYVEFHKIDTNGSETLVHSHNGVAQGDIANVLTPLLCDGTWKYAQVNVYTTTAEATP